MENRYQLEGKESLMIVTNTNDIKKNKIETFPYKGKPYAVKNVWI